jgi:hypothetical protein
VARIYAGILGSLAFLTSLGRGIAHGSQTESVLITAWCSLLVFAPLGYVIGWVAERIVQDSVRSRISDELDARRQVEEPEPAASATAGK